MLKKIKIGDHVQWIQEPWGGIVKKLEGQRALILLNDGFEEWESLSNLVLNNLQIDLEEIQDSKEEIKHVTSRQVKTDEIDLHIENLDIHWRKIPQGKILHRQIQAFQEEFQNSILNNMDELTVIHGKGSGILRDSLLHILAEKTNIRVKPLTEGKYKNAAFKIYFNTPL